MADIRWTADQEAAISAKGKNILVSAAAGSGKTAVLVERILRRIMEDGASIDEMLIVTFTNAAAAEMKEKINSRIRGYETKNDSQMRHKRRQLNSIADADISTIDSFCINCVRSNAHELDISRDFGICDETMGSMMTEEAIEGLFEEYYNCEDSSEFIALTEKYCTQYSDAPLAELLKKIYEFIQDYENPSAKLDEIFSLYDAGDDIFKREWAKDCERKQYEAIAQLMERLGIGTDGSLSGELAEFGGVMASGDADGIRAQDRVEEVHNAIKQLLDAFGRFRAIDRDSSDALVWDSLYEVRNVIRFIQKPLAICLSAAEKKNDVFNNVKAVYDRAVKLIWSAVDEAKKDFDYVCMSSQQLYSQFEDICHSVIVIKRMVIELSDRIRKMKIHRNVFTFQDIEHLTYELLDDENNELAERYRLKYSDILIDEYQDTNALQDAIFRKISRNNENIFMVGDLKQSIYAFRGGDPTIFREKGLLYGNYKGDSSQWKEGIRIDLDMNFRSNAEVVNAVNSLFGFIMTEGVGDVDYNKTGERLVCGRDADTSRLTPEELATRKKPELVVLPFINKKGNREMDGTTVIDHSVIEARYIAQRIREMVDNKELIFAGGEVRPVEYRDITIIGSSIKSLAALYNEEFDKAGIPLALPVMGYYDNYEVIVMISLLRLLVNRRLDIPLVTVMRSPIGGFTDDELADMSRGGSKVPLYERLLKACREYKPHIGDGATLESISDMFSAAAEREGRLSRIRRKAKRFIAMLDRFESYKRYKSVATIIYDIYTETRFYDFAGAMENGEMAQQNLTLLYEKAKQFAKSSADSLYGFVRYMEKVSAEGENEKGMSLINEEQNVVRMMTIHGSKGLEFPVVFGIRLGSDFRAIKSEEGIIHREAGIGLKFRDPDEKSFSEFPIYTWVKNKIKCENRGEDMRKLYVLMTRARERLICVMSKRCDSEIKYHEMRSAHQDMGEYLFSAEGIRNNERKSGSVLSAINGMEDAKGFYEWILPAYDAGVIKAADEKELLYWQYHSVGRDEISKLYDGNVLSVLDSSYRFAEMAELPSKTTVSKVKVNEHDKESTFSLRYAFNLDQPHKGGGAEKRIPANVMGTAYHQVMAFITPKADMSEDEARDMILSVAEDGEIAAEVAKEIDPKLVSAFYRSDTLGEAVVEAHNEGRLYRETPFEIYISPDVYNNELKKGDFCDEDRILLQGTIDCWFDDGLGNCTIIDYKTDKIGGADIEQFKADKIEEYRVQLDLYGEAINKLDGKRVVSRYLYLFAIDEFVEIPLEEG